MKKMIAVGAENFDDLIRDDGYYVDKTEMLYELAAETRNKVTLFTRPRRFGKTLTMRMMESFFDLNRDSREMFRDLDIQRNHPDFCEEWMNQYPVLFLSLKDVEGRSFELAYGMLKTLLSDLCKTITPWIKPEQVDPDDYSVFTKLKSTTGDEEDIRNSLKTISRMLYTVYGKPVILLIGEYDVPLAKAEATKDPAFYRQMLDLIRGLMSVSLKTNDYLKFAVITGCLRISKESIFTGVNNFVCYSVTSRRFSRYFGFTKDEVRNLLDDFRLAHLYDVIQTWYDGYIFGNTEVFCPWDVMSYLSSALYDEEEAPQNFWANTSSNAILDHFINHDRIDASEKFEILLNEGTITEDIREDLTYDTVADSEKNLWSVLLMTGYLSKADDATGTGKVRLRIPNAEVRELFRDAVVTRFQKRLDASKADAFVSALWNRDEKTASEALSDILWDSISYHDYGEDYYHGILNGIFSARGYRSDSNDEAGLGRLDLRVRDRPNRRLLLFEFKRSRREEDLEADCEEALGQVLRNGYAKRMPEGYRQQLVYGIAFYGKTAMVRGAE